MFLDFFNRRKTLQENNFFDGYTDWHCHLLPGVDDGVKTMKESLQILSIYEEQGVKEVWCTPHTMEDIPNTTKHLKERFAELQSAYQGGIKLHLASEYMLDHLFEEHLESNDILPLGTDGFHVLVETSYFNPPMGFYDLLKRIQSKGYYPVLAHPERYNYMSSKDYKKLKDMGIIFQMNIPSLLGLYSKNVQKKAQYLLKNGTYNLFGTDTHYKQFFLNILNSPKPSILKQNHLDF